VIYIGLMRHSHRDGSHRRFSHPEDQADRRHGGHYHHRRHHSGGPRGGRPFDYGELRTLALAMIAEQPRHGYELMKAIADRMGGSYSPSPGVMYPTLSWLDDMGYVTIDASEAGRKQYRISAEGEAFLTANRASVDALLARISADAAGAPQDLSAPIQRGMENLKVALRLRLKRGPLDQETAKSIAAALDEAAQAVERS
jgi:DNA-binding PadR family transcriptional regulator